MAITLPLVICIFDAYPLNRLNIREGFDQIKRAFLEKIPFLFLSGIIAALAFHSHQEIIAGLLLNDRLIIALRAVIFYIKNYFLPMGLSPYYAIKLPIIFSIKDLAWIIIISGITLLCILSWKKNRLWMTAWICYIVMLLPVLGIIQAGSQAAADRYTYLPTLGLMFLTGLLIANGFKKIMLNSERRNIFVTIYSFIIISILVFTGTTTVNQIKTWKDSVSLWSRVIQVSPSDSSLPYRLKGWALHQKGNYEKALPEYAAALSLDSSDFMAYYYRGLAYFALGKYEKALQDFEDSIYTGNVSPDVLYYRDYTYNLAERNKSLN